MAFLPLLVSDAIGLATAINAPLWGVYLNGIPVIQPNNQASALISSIVGPVIGPIQQLAALLGGPNLIPSIASTVEFHYSQDWNLPNYRQENGAFQSYNKVTLPFDVKMRLAANGSVSLRRAFLESVRAIGGSTKLFDVVTPELVFSSCNVEHVTWERRHDKGVELIVADIWFKEIAVVGATAFTNTQQPGNQQAQSTGFQQPQAPSSQVSSTFSSRFSGLQ